MSQVDYKALNRPTGTNLNQSVTNLKESIHWLLKSFTQTVVYERYNVVLCCITTLCGFAYLFLSTNAPIGILMRSYHYSFLTFLEISLCFILLFDMVANIQSNDINYVLTSAYYRDMGLFIMNMVILSLVSICHGYGMQLGMRWIRIQFFCHETKYLPPSVLWALHMYNEVRCNKPVAQRKKKAKAHSLHTSVLQNSNVEKEPTDCASVLDVCVQSPN